MKRKKVLSVGIVSLGIVFSFLCTGFDAIAEDKGPIKIGLTTELTGPQLVHGTGVQRGVEAYAHKINKEGGVLGRRVELITLDDKSQPPEAVKNARDLVYTHNVDFIIQGINSASSLGVSQVAKTSKVPVLINGTTAAATMAQGHRYVFRAIESTASPAYFAAKYINRHYPEAKRVYLMGSDFEWGRVTTSSFFKYMKGFNSNVEMAGESYVKIAETNYAPYISKIKGIKPDVVFLAITVTSPFLKQAKPVNLFRESAVISPGWNVNEIVSMSKEDLPEGVIWGGTCWYAMENTLNSEFVALIRELFNIYPYSPEYHGYISAMFGIEAIKRAESTDKEKIVLALEGMTLDTPVGLISIRDFDHQSTYPSFLGRVEWSDKYGFGILKNLDRFSADEALPSYNEVQAARK